jgi:hypothetical protein
MDKFTKAYREIQELRDIFLENADSTDSWDIGYAEALKDIIDVLVKIEGLK